MYIECQAPLYTLYVESVNHETIVLDENAQVVTDVFAIYDKDGNGGIDPSLARSSRAFGASRAVGSG